LDPKIQRPWLWKKKHDLQLATWNIRTLNYPGALQNLKDQIRKHNIGIAALQEIRWKGKGIIYFKKFTIIYSEEDDNFGTGFIIHDKYKHGILNYGMRNERLCTLRMKGKIFNMTLINVHAPTEEKDEIKDEFYAQLTEIYDCQPGHDIKIGLGNLNAKIGREEVYKSVAGKESLHEFCNNNGWRLIDFPTVENMKVMGTYLQRKNIHK
jgi:exonuclease III